MVFVKFKAFFGPRMFVFLFKPFGKPVLDQEINYPENNCSNQGLGKVKWAYSALNVP